MAHQCNYCGQYPALIVNPNGTMACKRCAGLFNTCHLCLNSTNCEFETNPSPLPKQVQQTIRKGNVQVQSVVKNPERIQLCCTSCHCWNAEGYCNREYLTCGNYNEFIPSPISDE
jgi:hypothetical protein